MSRGVRGERLNNPSETEKTFVDVRRFSTVNAVFDLKLRERQMAFIWVIGECCRALNLF